MTHHVFISYRRAGGIHLAARIKDGLERLGVKVFLDNSDLKLGSYAKQLEESVEDCLLMVPVWTSSYFDRCSEENDWVYKELSLALKYNKLIVPLIDEGFTCSADSVVPESIKPILEQQGVSYHPALHDASIAELFLYVTASRREQYRRSACMVYENGSAVQSELKWLHQEQQELGLTDEEADLICKEAVELYSKRKSYLLEIDEAAEDVIVSTFERIRLEDRGRRLGYQKEEVARLLNEALARFEAQNKNMSNEQAVSVNVHPSDPPASEFHHQVEPQPESIALDQCISLWFTSIRGAIFS